MGKLVPETLPGMSPELQDLIAAAGKDYRPYAHDDLIVIHSLDEYDLEEAFLNQFGIRRWRHVSVSVRGQWAAALADQRFLGRKRKGGERSPVPLPDWYDLTHLAYEHAAELGFNRLQAVWQYLPPPGEEYLNIAEALHLRQPL
jgi:hypothetical protein